MQDLWSKEVSLKPLREKSRTAFYAFMVTACALLAFIILVDLLLLLSPVNPWFDAAVVISGSMEPTIMTGSIIIITEEEEYQVGEIIAFIDPLVGKNTHRIIAVEEREGVTYYVTKGDAAENQDAFMVTKERVTGKVRLIFSRLGYVAYIGFAAILIPLSLLIFHYLRKLRSRRSANG